MARNQNETHHAPAKRAHSRIIEQQSEILTDQTLLIDVLNAVPTQVVILNKERQIVFGNSAFLHMTGKGGLKEVTGLRVGEAVGCVHADESDGGCGTTAFCRFCGAVNAMLSAQKGQVDIQECRIIQKEDSRAIDLRVMASPFRVKGDQFTIFSMLDIADEKRRDVLERIFLHDLMNTAGGLRGFTRLLTTASEEDMTRFSLIVDQLANRLVDEIETHRQLKQAENAELQTQVSQIHTLDLLNRVKDNFAHHEAARGRSIQVTRDAQNLLLRSDESLVHRVLGNMTKNALEAIQPGETVTLNCRQHGGRIRFSVHNPGEIPRDARMQVFQRSFSTKGTGRGLGTYSMKLLSEQYLHGNVGFTSSQKEGTVFYAEYPLQHPADSP